MPGERQGSLPPESRKEPVTPKPAGKKKLGPLAAAALAIGTGLGGGEFGARRAEERIGKQLDKMEERVKANIDTLRAKPDDKAGHAAIIDTGEVRLHTESMPPNERRALLQLILYLDKLLPLTDNKIADRIVNISNTELDDFLEWIDRIWSNTSESDEYMSRKVLLNSEVQEYAHKWIQHFRTIHDDYQSKMRRYYDEAYATYAQDEKKWPYSKLDKVIDRKIDGETLTVGTDGQLLNQTKLRMAREVMYNLLGRAVSIE